MPPNDLDPDLQQLQNLLSQVIQAERDAKEAFRAQGLCEVKGVGYLVSTEKFKALRELVDHSQFLLHELEARLLPTTAEEEKLFTRLKEVYVFCLDHTLQKILTAFSTP